jgi:molybdenum cofactor synthesis domain-containing protein
MLGTALRTAGAVVEQIAAAADTPEAHREALARALEHDVVISSGGVSVGPHDLVRGIGQELGVRELFWRIALRPGKPLTFGVRDRTLVFGLPGNPVSTLVCFELFVRPALRSLQGAPEFRPAFGAGVLGSDVARNRARDDLIRVQVAWTSMPGKGRGHPVLLPLSEQQSHQIAIAAQADALARIPAGSGDRLRVGGVCVGHECAAVPFERLGRRPQGHPGEQLRLRLDLAGRRHDRLGRPGGWARVEAVAVAEPVRVGRNHLHVQRRHAQLARHQARVLRLLTVGLDRQAASSAILILLFGQSLALFVRGQSVVLLQVAERRLRSAERVRRHGRAPATRVDAALHGVRAHPMLQPGVVLPRLGP